MSDSDSDSEVDSYSHLDEKSRQLALVIAYGNKKIFKKIKKLKERVRILENAPLVKEMVNQLEKENEEEMSKDCSDDYLAFLKSCHQSIDRGEKEYQKAKNEKENYFRF